jgi:tetratricopeptide (TPR) repeat protein
MGLHTGEATLVAGDYYGTPVNRAARLMSLASGGQTIISQSTERLVHDHLPVGVGLLDIGDHQLRGLSHTERVFQVTHPDLPRSFPPLRSLDDTLQDLLAGLDVPFPPRLRPPARHVGRAEELARLDRCWDDVRAGAQRVAFVAGEPGIGKSALVARLATRAHADGAIVLFGRCDEDFGVAYAPFVEALDELVVRLPEPLVDAHLEEYGPHLAQVVPGLRRHARATPTTGIDPDEQRFQLFASIAGLLGMVGKAHPVVLVLDDLQWASKPTASLLRHLLAWANPMRLLVAVTYRDSEVGADHPLHDVTALPLTPPAERIRLAGLGGAELGELLTSAAGHHLDDTAAPLLDALSRDTGGNPFFVSELLRHLVETNALYQDEAGRWQLRGGFDLLELPESTREVVHQRVAHLGADAPTILASAAVIGQDFELGLLATTLELPEETVLGELERAEHAALVRNVTGDQFQFRHALVQQALYQGLGAARRSRAHVRVADAMERAGLATLHPEASAHHLAASGRPEALVRARDYARRAAEAAMTSLAPDAAVGYYRDALALAEQTAAPDAERCELLIGLGAALRQAGDGTHREVLLDAARLADRLGDRDRLVRATLTNSRGWASHTGAIDDEKIEMLEAALRRVGPDDSEARARLLAVLVAELTFKVPLEERRSLSDEAIGIARRLGDPSTLTWVLSTRFNAVRAPHLLGERIQYGAENVAAARQTGDPMALWHAVMEQTQLYVETGSIAELEESLALEVQLADDLRQPYPRWLTTCHRVARAILAGDTDDAERLCEEALKIGSEGGQPDALTLYAGELFAIRDGQGRLAELEPLMEQAAADNPGIPGLRAGVVHSYCERGALDEARAVLDEQRARGFDSFHVDGVWLCTMRLYATVAADVGDADAARELYDLLVPFADQVAADGANVQGPLGGPLGRLAAVMGRHDDAEAWFRRAVAQEERLGAALELARTQVSWAEMLLDRGRAADAPRARELSEIARVVAGARGWASVAARADAVLARAG